MADPKKPTDGAPPRAVNVDAEPPRAIHVGPKNKSANWLPWLLLALGVLALLYYLLGRNHQKEVVTTTTTTEAASTPTPVTTTPATATAAGGMVGETATADRSIGTLGTFFQGTDAAPATFVFDTLKFDTDKSDIKDADKATLDQVAGVLKAHTGAKAKIVGFADATGDPAHNDQLGVARANAVKAALVQRGVVAGQLDTASGGAANPVANNTTAGGRAANRRTEFVITSR